MSDPFMRIPEPTLPEHLLLRDAAQLPQLSSGLRGRIVVDVHRQLRNGRWTDRLRITGAVLAASLIVFFVWNFRWTGQEQIPEQTADAVKSNSPPVSPETPLMPSGTYSTAGSAQQTPAPPQLPQGGPSSRPEMKEMQQLNQLIEEIQGRNNTLCGLLPVW